MGKKVEPIVSAMGVFMSFINGLVEAVKNLGGTMESIYKLATSEGAETLKKIAEIIVKDNQPKNPFLRLISGNESLIIKALTGKLTIAEAKKTFKSYIDLDFKNWNLNKAGQKTGQIPKTDVYELVADATFVQMFGSLSDNLDKLVMSQSQIIEFCEKYPTWLRQDGYATFFLIKEDGKYFVVSVRVGGVGLSVDVDRFEDDYVWGAERRRRLVVPQL
jgi:hypothetical protein